MTIDALMKVSTLILTRLIPESLTLYGAMSSTGLESLAYHKGPGNSDSFYTFLSTKEVAVRNTESLLARRDMVV